MVIRVTTNLYMFKLQFAIIRGLYCQNMSVNDKLHVYNILLCLTKDKKHAMYKELILSKSFRIIKTFNQQIIFIGLFLYLKSFNTILFYF